MHVHSEETPPLPMSSEAKNSVGSGMARGAAVTSWFEGELQAVAAESGCEVIHLAFAGSRLQIVIDHPEGVTLEHCETVSRQASALLDHDDFGDRQYVLEVTSPGLDRQLYRPADYVRFAGRLVRVTYFGGDDRRKATVVGRLTSIEPEFSPEQTIPADTVMTLLSKSGTEIRIPMADIKIARLEIEL